MKKTDSQIDYRDWYIADCNIPFGSGFFRPRFNNFEESDGKKWIYLCLLLARKEIYEWRGEKIAQVKEGFWMGRNFVRIENSTHLRDLDASRSAEYVEKIRSYHFPSARSIILDAHLKVLESKSRKRGSKQFERIPIERHPELLEFFHPKPWLECGILDWRDPFWEWGIERFIIEFVRYFVWAEMTEEKEEEAEEIAEHIVERMSESELENFKDTYLLDTHPVKDFSLWLDIFQVIWDSLCLVEGRTIMDRSTFASKLFEIKIWIDIAKGRDSVLFDALALFIETLPQARDYSIEKLLNLRLLGLRSEVETLYQNQKKQKEQCTSALEEFLARCYEALVDKLVKKGITKRCKLEECRLPIVPTPPNKKYCQKDPEGVDHYTKYWNNWTSAKKGRKRRKPKIEHRE